MTAHDQWRQRAHYAGLAATGRAGLAWEVLRRDRAYHADCVGRLIPLSGKLVWLQSVPSDRELMTRWGLCFRRRSQAHGHSRLAHLDRNG